MRFRYDAILQDPMTREDFSFTSSDGLEVACYRWAAPVRPVGIVQIAHGMGEHAIRYAPAAAFLTDAGFHVYANDHRGHGRTATSRETLGAFGAGGWNALVADLAALSRIARERDRGLPLVLLGHSMGSFAAQQYLLDHSALSAAVVLSGSVAVDKLTFDTDRTIDLSALNQAIANPRTPYDWLSRDPAVVDAYIADPRCGFGVNPRAVQAMAQAAPRMADPAELKRIRRDLPIYILAGDKDPLNRDLEWLKPLAERYRSVGLADVTEKYYPGGRHEMLNETNRDEVLRDLLGWLRHALV
jgi:alpha-beta hydrolase superfamily lysophospholipase